jgi:hemoglobin
VLGQYLDAGAVDELTLTVRARDAGPVRSPLRQPGLRNTRPVRPSLFEFAGGEPAFRALAAAHHARCVADPELSHPFSHPGQHPQHVERLAAYWAEVMGGPPAYSAACGDQSALLVMHAGNGDMSDLGRRFVACFDAAADDAELPDDPDFRSALHAYMVWAVADVLEYGSPDAVVPGRLPMPRWSWDGPQPGQAG